MKIFIIMVAMILSVHSGVNFVPESIEMPVENEVQVEGKMEGEIIHLSRDRIITKRRKYKGRHQYRRYNATKKRYADSRWRNSKKRR